MRNTYRGLLCSKKKFLFLPSIKAEISRTQRNSDFGEEGLETPGKGGMGERRTYSRTVTSSRNRLSPGGTGGSRGHTCLPLCLLSPPLCCILTQQVMLSSPHKGTLLGLHVLQPPPFPFCLVLLMAVTSCTTGNKHRNTPSFQKTPIGQE